MAGMAGFIGSASPSKTVSTSDAVIAYPSNRCDLRCTSSLLGLQVVRRPKVPIGFRHDVAADDERDACDEGCASTDAEVELGERRVAVGKRVREHGQRERRHRVQEHDSVLQELAARARRFASRRTEAPGRTAASLPARTPSVPRRCTRPRGSRARNRRSWALRGAATRRVRRCRTSRRCRRLACIRAQGSRGYPFSPDRTAPSTSPGSPTSFSATCSNMVKCCALQLEGQAEIGACRLLDAKRRP